jgi:23S rRNA (cytidine1920-2'-O)/16S rRNA (cytidine1409-2'-O)-methyltransferase
VGIVALIKPQFEAGRKDVGKGGVVKDVNVHRRVLTEVLTFAIEQELNVKGLIPSPLLGPKGNVEFLVWLGSGGVSLDIAQAVEVALEEITK